MYGVRTVRYLAGVFPRVLLGLALQCPYHHSLLDGLGVNIFFFPFSCTPIYNTSIPLVKLIRRLPSIKPGHPPTLMNSTQQATQGSLSDRQQHLLISQFSSISSIP